MNTSEPSSQAQVIDMLEAEQSMEVEPSLYGEPIDMSETESLAEGESSLYEEAIDELETELSSEEGPSLGAEPPFHEEVIDTSAPPLDPMPHSNDQNHTGLLSSSFLKL